MLRKFESLLPPFLRKLDRRLLLHRPSLWASKIHYVLFFGLLGLGLVYLTRFYPLSLTDIPNPTQRTFFLLIPMSLALLFYAWRVSLFSVEKQFGQNGPKLHLRDQVIYMGVILIALGLPVLYGLQLGHKVDQSLSVGELTEDLNHLHLGEGYLEKTGILENNEYYPFSDYYHSYGWRQEQTLDHLDLTQLIETGNQEDFEQRMRTYFSTLKKYSWVPFEFDQMAFFKHQSQRSSAPYTDYRNLERARFSVQANIDQLIRIKTGEEFLLENEFWQIAGLFVFWSWIVLMVFLQSDWKHFAGLLGIVAVGGLLVSLLSTVLGRVLDVSEVGFTSLVLLVIFGLSLTQALRKNRSTRGQIWKRLNLMAVSLGLPFIPLLLVQAMQKLGNAYSSVDSDTAYTLLYLGVGLTVLLWNVLLHRQFVKLQAEPVGK